MIDACDPIANICPPPLKDTASKTQKRTEREPMSSKHKLGEDVLGSTMAERRYLKRQYDDAFAVPLSPRLATLITQLETQHVSA